MTSLFKQAVASQFEAGLGMLREAVERCPAGLWEAPVGERAYWEVAFHVTYYVDLYLTRPGKDWPGMPDWAWPHAAGLGWKMEPPFDALTPEEVGPVLEQGRVAEYVVAMSPKLRASLDPETDETLAGESGFSWLSIPRAETYLYNLRHVQHHAGQLCAVLRREGVAVDWIGKGNSEP